MPGSTQWKGLRQPASRTAANEPPAARRQVTSTQVTQETPVERTRKEDLGTIGIARALQLAGLAAGNDHRRQAAEDAALAALGDPARLARVTDASLCHGWAGILTVTQAIAADSPAPERFAAPVRLGRDRLATEIAALPKPGFLEGRAGAQLALDGTDSTGWTRALLIR